MDLSIFTQFISNLGFPIACVIALFWQMQRERETHHQESTQWMDAINRNTAVMNRVLDHLERKDEDNAVG